MEVAGSQHTKAAIPPATLDPIASFPTSGQPISDTMLKDMLLSQCQADVQAMGERINHIDSAMGEYSVSFNKLVDALNHDHWRISLG